MNCFGAAITLWPSCFNCHELLWGSHYSVALLFYLPWTALGQPLLCGPLVLPAMNCFGAAITLWPSCFTCHELFWGNQYSVALLFYLPWTVLGQPLLCGPLVLPVMNCFGAAITLWPSCFTCHELFWGSRSVAQLFYLPWTVLGQPVLCGPLVLPAMNCFGAAALWLNCFNCHELLWGSQYFVALLFYLPWTVLGQPVLCGPLVLPAMNCFGAASTLWPSCFTCHELFWGSQYFVALLFYLPWTVLGQPVLCGPLVLPAMNCFGAASTLWPSCFTCHELFWGSQYFVALLFYLPWTVLGQPVLCGPLVLPAMNCFGATSTLWPSCFTCHELFWGSRSVAQLFYLPWTVLGQPVLCGPLVLPAMNCFGAAALWLNCFNCHELLWGSQYFVALLFYLLWTVLGQPLCGSIVLTAMNCFGAASTLWPSCFTCHELFWGSQYFVALLFYLPWTVLGQPVLCGPLVLPAMNCFGAASTLWPSCFTCHELFWGSQYFVALLFYLPWTVLGQPVLCGPLVLPAMNCFGAASTLWPSCFTCHELFWGSQYFVALLLYLPVLSGPLAVLPVSTLWGSCFTCQYSVALLFYPPVLYGPLVLLVSTLWPSNCFTCQYSMGLLFYLSVLYGPLVLPVSTLWPSCFTCQYSMAL